MSNKKGFLLYKDSYDAIKELDYYDKAMLLDAIFEYNISRKTLDLSPMAKMAFMFLKPHFDRDIEKYQNICDRNANNGRLGGRPKSNPENPVGYLETQTKRVEPKKAHIDIDIDIDTNNDLPINNTHSLPTKEIETNAKEEFEGVWLFYPNKQGKAAARDRFVKMYKNDQSISDKIKRAVLAYADDCKRNKRELQYIKHGSTFLNGGWEDWVDKEIKPKDDFYEQIKQEAGL